MNSDDDVRRVLDRLAAEPGFRPIDPAPVLARAYRRLARTTTVMGLAGVTLVAAIGMAGPNPFQAHALAMEDRTWMRPALPSSLTACTSRSSRITRDDGAKCYPPIGMGGERRVQ